MSYDSRETVFFGFHRDAISSRPRDFSEHGSDITAQLFTEKELNFRERI